ncbi:hypothetical protein [Silvanigrella aquatica]|uniref:hypothetical protein n=1 Tax=Silvanigrella aquatica TaxID=1915309 RepID=UPI000AC2D414|nr:hypothetical protein [Silvanigrella aquatica]
MKFKNKLNFFIITISAFLSFLCYAEENKSSHSLNYFTDELYSNECPRNGAVAGRISIQGSEYYNSSYLNDAVIRIAGMDYTNNQNKEYEYYPNANGCFSIDNIFPIGSSMYLYVDNIDSPDNKDSLFKNYFPVNVGYRTNFYEVNLSLNSYIGNLSQAFNYGSKQFFEKTGLCGEAIGFASGDILGTEVYIKNAIGKIFKPKFFNEKNLPDPSRNNLSLSGQFCFFNLDACDNNGSNCSINSNYELIFTLKNGMTRSFDLFLPPFSFSSSNYFDLNLNISRPVELYSLAHSLDKNIIYTPVYNYFIKTSKENNDKYIHILNGQNQLVYFPVGNEFVKISYKTDLSQSDRFFILKPRSELFTANMEPLLVHYNPGYSLQDQNTPLKLKIFDPDVLNLNQNILSKIYLNGFGSVFFNFDFSQYELSSEDISVHLYDFYGKEIYNFYPLSSSEANYISGFYFALEPGFYRLAVINNQDNKNEFLLSSIVRSIANKTQVVTNQFDSSSSSSSEHQFQNNATVVVDNLMNYGQQTSNVDVLPYNEEAYVTQIDRIHPDEENLTGVHALQIEKAYSSKSLFNRMSAEELCNVKNFVSEFKNEAYHIHDLKERFNNNIPALITILNEEKLLNWVDSNI